MFSEWAAEKLQVSKKGVAGTAQEGGKVNQNKRRTVPLVKRGAGEGEDKNEKSGPTTSQGMALAEI